MTKRTLGALVVLNAVLLAALAVVTVPTQDAHAQFAAGRNYVMIAGEVVGRESQHAVYILEQNSARMIALFFNSANNTVQFLAGRDLGADSGGGR